MGRTTQLHITRAVAAMDSCFGRVEPQHGIARHQCRTRKFFSPAPFTAEADAKHPFKRQLHTIHVVAVAGTVEQSRHDDSAYGVVDTCDPCSLNWAYAELSTS